MPWYFASVVFDCAPAMRGTATRGKRRASQESGRIGADPTRERRRTKARRPRRCVSAVDAAAGALLREDADVLLVPVGVEPVHAVDRLLRRLRRIVEAEQ